MTLVAPSSPLSDGIVDLRPLHDGDISGFDALVADPAVRRFTRVPDPPPPGFAAEWLDRYVTAWSSGERAGFAIELADGGMWAGFAGIVDYDAHAAEGELGYIVASAARGRGVATRALRLLSQWALEQAGLARVELIVDVDNRPSLSVARRAGFTHEGIRRSSWVKGDVRADVAVWSLLAGERDRLVGT